MEENPEKCNSFRFKRENEIHILIAQHHFLFVEEKKIFMSQPTRSRTSQRFVEVDPPSNDSTFSDDYLQEQLVSLEKALLNFRNDIIDLDQYIKLAKDSCNRSSNYGLTYDDSAAIYLYTMQWKEGDQHSLYFIMNRTLRSRNHSDKKRWFPFLKIFIPALMKFPLIVVSVWRILKEDVGQDYSTGKTFVWSSVTSCSRDLRKIMKEFWKPNGENTLFKIEVTKGRDISAYSRYADEQEVVLLPGARFRVTGQSMLEKIDIYENIPVTHLQQI